MRILVWNAKHGDVLVCARDGEQEARAWLYIFKCMDENEYYCDLEDDEANAYMAAKEGSAGNARWLLEMRSDCEYERVIVRWPVQP